jgi:GTPase SAR1 family protein
VQIRNIDIAIELEDENDEVDGITGEMSSSPLTEVQLCDQPRRKLRLFGSPDPSVPSSQVPCHGCGANLHCRDPGVAGYVPSQIFVATKASQLSDLLCQRCHLLTEFNVAIDVSVKPLEYEAIEAEILRTSPALLLIILDLTDLPNSFYDGFARLASAQRPVYVIANKVDLLPYDGPGYLSRVKDSVCSLCTARGIEPRHIALISAKTGYGVERLITQMLNDWRLRGQVFILGCTNVGKSTLFNSLLASDFCRIAARDVIQRATSSIWPGTTLNLLKFPIMNPKPSVLHRRMLRLHQQQAAEASEEELRRTQLKATGCAQYATLMGHIGLTSVTPGQVALSRHLEQHHNLGFLVPSYEYQLAGTAGSSADCLQDFVGQKSAMNQLKVQVEPYNDRSFKYWCYDTPGLVNPHQVINILTCDELMVLLVNELMTPRSFYFKPSQVMFVSGLGRIDYVKGDAPVVLTVFAASSVPVHVLQQDAADDFYRANIGRPLLGIPLGDTSRLNSLPSLIGREFTVCGIGSNDCAADIVLSSLGWVSVTGSVGQEVTLRAYTPAGLGCHLRTPALLQYAVNLRGKRVRGTSAYHIRPPKFCLED